ncbi:MAG: HNH endonuclease signature motif containing protein [Patescibacteria group bacterium]|jgi:hypothetical protein
MGGLKSRFEITAFERIKSKILINQKGCWLYQGKLTIKGYAHVRSSEGKMRFAHRITYEQKYGPVEFGKELDHKCRNRHCCNPDHLEEVTHQVNCARGMAKYVWKRLRRNSTGQFAGKKEQRA